MIFRLLPITLGIFWGLINAICVKAAESNYYTEKKTNLSVSVESLTTQEKALFFQNSSNPILLVDFFNTEIGKEILTQLSKLINISGDVNKDDALRAAIINAALNPQDGLSLINILRNLPPDVQLQASAVSNK